MAHLRLLYVSHGIPRSCLFVFPHISRTVCFDVLLQSLLHSPTTLPPLYLHFVSIMSAPALCFTFSASSLCLCPSPPVSMILPLLGLCSFIISLLHSLASFLFLRVLLTKPWLADMRLLIMIPRCLRWRALSYSESLWKSLTSWTDARWDRVSLSSLGNCTVKWLCLSNNWVVLFFWLKRDLLSVYFGYWV